MKILMIDNYDSFTYNLVQFIENYTGSDIDVYRNDKINIEKAAEYDKIAISPGPGIPDEAGITKNLIKELGPEKSIFGVCLGHQAICEVFGGELINLDKVYHGVPGKIKQIIPDYIFRDVPFEFEGGRYHSWIASAKLPEDIELIADNPKGEVMAVRHKKHDIRGVQFHPESVLTEFGGQIINNWLKGE